MSTLRRTPPGPRSTDDGFTLVEVLVTMMIATVVLFAVLQAADVFARSTDRARNLSDTQDSGRTTLRSVVAELRQSRSAGAGSSSPLVAPQGTTTVSARDLIAAAFVPASSSTVGWVRFCVSSDGRSFYTAHRTGPLAPTNVPACGTDANGWTHKTLVDGRLRDANVFSYTTDPSTTSAACRTSAPVGSVCLPVPAEVRGIGIRLSIADRPSDSGSRIVLDGAVSLRNRSPI